ncbi:hypothetical protein BSKO_01510 [Bryopsis sp. KO-2023]|nr:hypothetical protein BSKO_01510 [Bryopsis sp. KO-2023]
MAERTWEYRRNRALIELDNQLRAARSSALLRNSGARDGDRVGKSVNPSGIVGEENGEPSHNALRLFDPPQGGCGSLQPSVGRNDAIASLSGNEMLAVGSEPRSTDPKSALLALSEEAERLQQRLHETTGRERVLQENLEIQNKLHSGQLANVEEEAKAEVRSWQHAAKKMASIVNPKRLQKLAFAVLQQRARESRSLAFARRAWEIRILQSAFLGWLVELKKRRKRDAGLLAAVINEWVQAVKLEREARGRENLRKLRSAFVSFKLHVERRQCQKANETWTTTWRQRRSLASAWKYWRESMYWRRKKENDRGLAHSWWRTSTLCKGCKGWKITVRQRHQEREFQSRSRARTLATTYDQWCQFVEGRKLRERLLTIPDKQHKYRAASSAFRYWCMVTVAMRNKRQDLEHRRTHHLLATAFDALAMAAEEAKYARHTERVLVSSIFEVGTHSICANVIPAERAVSRLVSSVPGLDVLDKVVAATQKSGSRSLSSYTVENRQKVPRFVAEEDCSFDCPFRKVCDGSLGCKKSVTDHADEGWYRSHSDLEAVTITARRDFAMCNVGTDKFIVIGGFGGEFELGDVQMATLSWKEADSTRSGGPCVVWTEVNANGPRFSGRSHHSAEYHRKSNHVCVFGGYQTSFGCLNETWVLDMGRQKWKQIPQVLRGEPPPRRGHASVIVGDRMYIQGGFDGDTHSCDLFVFDMLLHKWTEIEPKGAVPCGRRSHAIEAINDTCIVMHGGFDGKEILDDVFVLRLDTHIWTKVDIQGCPIPRALHSLVFSYDQLLACGGMGDEGQEKHMMVLEDQAHRDVLDRENRLRDAERRALMLAHRCNQLEEENRNMEEQAMKMVEQQERAKVSLHNVKRNLNIRETDI